MQCTCLQHSHAVTDSGGWISPPPHTPAPFTPWDDTTTQIISASLTQAENIYSQQIREQLHKLPAPCDEVHSPMWPAHAQGIKQWGGVKFSFLPGDPLRFHPTYFCLDCDNYQWPGETSICDGLGFGYHYNCIHQSTVSKYQALVTTLHYSDH